MSDQFGRKVSLILFEGDKGIDLSEFRIRFNVSNADFESPGTLAVRVYNLSQNTIVKIKGEFSQVTLNAGYQEGNYGVVFSGAIKQYRIGRENNKDSYLDIFAADGDIGMNFGVVNTTLAAGSTPQDQVKAVIASMPGVEIDSFPDVIQDLQHQPSLRGKTMVGMSRARLRNLASSLDFTWSIENGKVIFLPVTGYRAGEAVKINVATGLIGIPEQTDDGIRATCLLNSKLRIGGLVQLNNSEITQLIQQNLDAAPIPYNQWTGFQFNTPLSEADVNGDGTYRLYAVEHEGDSRGHEWYSHLTMLAVDISAPKDKSVSPPK